MPAIFNGGAYSITAVRTYVRPVLPIRNTNDFRAISFEKIGVLNWNFIHRYIIIKCRSIQFRVKSTNYFGSYGPFSTLKKFSTLKNGFHSISFEKISVLDSNFIHRYIIIKCRSSSIKVKSNNYFGSYGPFKLWQMVSVPLFFKRLVCWIHIIYTSI